MTQIDLRPSNVAGRESTFQGMRCVDTSGNPRIPILMEMVGELSRADDPIVVQRIFGDGLSRMYGTAGYVSLSVRGLKPGEYKITRIIDDLGARNNPRSNPWKDWASLPVHTGGFFGEIIRNAYPELIHHFHLRDDPVVGNALAHFGSMMAIPLFDQGEPLNWSITLRRDPEGFSEQELEDAILRTNLGGATVKNVLVNRQLREANAHIRKEIDEIARIQRALLPQTLPKLKGISIATSYETFDTAGGDMYDLAVVHDPERAPDEQMLGMLIADAAGHGPAAAVVAAMINAIFYTYGERALGGGPAGLLQYANEHLMAKRLEGTFVTAFAAVFDPLTRQLVYARAGHNPPLLKDAGSGGEVTRIEDVGGIPLGVIEHATYDNGLRPIQPGQTLVLYTDGIVEAMNPHREMFGVEGIERALAQCTGEPQCVITSITTALREHEAGMRPADDQTIVAIRVD